MGRQVNFFVDQKDVVEFVTYVCQRGGLFLNRRGTRIDDPRSQSMTTSRMYIWTKGRKVVTDDIIDYDRSEVIEFTISDCDQHHLILQRGRLWYQTTIWDPSTGSSVRKSPELDKDFDYYKRYIQKNFRRCSNCNWIWAGPGAYDLYRRGWKLMLDPIEEARFE